MENKENEVKKCKHCQSDIPKKAKICPNCRKKQGGKLKFIIAWIFLIIIFSLQRIPHTYQIHFLGIAQILP